MAGLYDYIAEGKVKRDELANCVEFIIMDDDIFSKQGMGMLRAERHSGFIKCSRSLQDGYECVRYSVVNSGFKPLRSVLGKIKAENFVQCLVNLKSIFNISDFADEGYMNKNNVAVRFNDVYIDVNSSRAYILYVPLTTLTNDNSCEKILGEEILSAVKSYGNLFSPLTTELCDLIRRNVPAFQAITDVSNRYGIKPVNYELLKTVTDYTPNPEEIERNIRKEQIERNEIDEMIGNSAQSHFGHNRVQQPPFSQVAPVQPVVNDPPKPGKYGDDTGTQIMQNTGLYLVSKKRREEFPLNFGENIVGRNDEVDIDLVGFNNGTISHSHATIYVEADGRIAVMDHSKNGTSIVTSGFMGRSKVEKLVPNKKYYITVGTCLKFSNEEFTIVRK